MSNPAAPKPFPEKRAALRTATAIEIVLKCPDKSGKTFIEKTRTVDVSRTGAKALTEHPVSHGLRLQMAIPQRKRMSWATVARVGNKTGNLQEIGIAIDETNDFWGVQLPAETQVPRGAGLVPKQVGTEPGASTVRTEMNPSLALVQELLAATELKQEIPSATPEAEYETSDELSEVLREQVRSAMAQSLGEALQQLNEQAAEIMKKMPEVITQQTEARLRQGVEAALRHVEAAALDVTKRSQPVWEQRIQALADSAQEQLRAQLAEHETHLVASAAKLRRELARRLADLSGTVGED